MAEQKNEGGLFTCYVCGMNEKYTYFGRRPKFAPDYSFLEDVYLLKDPFSSPNQKSFLFLGSHCCLCNKMVCQSQECSLFFSKRFCLNCAHSNSREFPFEIQQELNKRRKKKE